MFQPKRFLQVSVRDKIAARIYANNVDLKSPLYHQECINESYQAADIFMKHMNKDKPDRFTLSIVEAFLKSGKKIHGIKEVRDRTGLGLKEAKEAVDFFEAEGQWSMLVVDKLNSRSTADLDFRDHNSGLPQTQG